MPTPRAPNGPLRALGLPNGRRTIFVADAHRDNGKRFVLRAEEKLTAFIELEVRLGPSVRKIKSVHRHGQRRLAASPS
jgi:hypothetical protein